MSFPAEAERLTSRIPQILQLWEEAVRTEPTASRMQRNPMLRAHLPELLNLLASLLRGDPSAERAWMEAAHHHGDACARQQGSTLELLLVEYRVLRRLLAQVLEREAPLSGAARDALSEAIEAAMQHAAAGFNTSQQERVRREAEQHRLLVENARDYAMFLTDCENRITSWSTGAERLTGFTEAEILGQKGEIIFTPEDRAKQEPEKEVAKARAEGRAENERWHLRKDGSRFWGSGILHAVYDDDGRLTGFGKVFRDRTADWKADQERDRYLQEAQQELARRQRLETDLRRYNERLRLLSEVAATLLLSEEPEQIVAPVFRRLTQHLDLDVYLNFVVGPDFTSLRLSSYSGVPKELASRLQVIQFGDAVCGKVAQDRRPRVAHRVQESFDPVLDEVRSLGIQAYACHPLLAGDRLVGTLSFGSRHRAEFTADDLSLIETVSNQVAVALDRSTLMRELAERADALAEADERKDEFLAMLAHELRNPLAPVLTSVAVMRLRSQDDPALQRSLETVERQVRQLARLVDDLLDVSRITQGTIELRQEPVNLLTVVAHAVETIRPMVESRRHQLNVSVPPYPICVQGDAARLEQIIVNLLSNAVRYTDLGGRIWLTAEAEGDAAVLRVRDTGRGIPRDMLQHVFGLFTQVEVTIDRAAGGLGLGLTLVKRLVEMHGGEVTAYSEGPGRGSEFTVRLPRMHRETAPSTKPADEPSPESGRSLRILVVDDNVDAAQTLADLLELWGYQARIALDGHRALTAAAEFQPHVVLLDIGLPGLDGYEVARRIQERSAPPSESAIAGSGGTEPATCQSADLSTCNPELGAPLLVAVTGYGQEEDRRRAAEVGFSHHLTKPVDPAALRRILALASEL